MSLRDWFWVILLGVIWGTSFLFNAIMIRELGPLWVSALRVTIGALGCWAVFVALKKPLPRDWRLWAQLAALGVLSYAIPFALFPLSQQHLASGVAAIINALTPITTVVVSQFWPGGEKATWLKVLGIIAGFAGAAILALPALLGGGSSELWAIGACLLATGCYALSLNITRSFRNVDPTTLATLALTGGAIVATIAAFTVEGMPVITRTETVLAALGIGLVATAFAFQVMYRILPRIGATNFSTVTFIAPVSAILFGVTILGERLTVLHFAGMAAIFLGLLLIDGRIVKRFRKAAA
jgi:drug/metabolite transporter (DMT)-like permease